MARGTDWSRERWENGGTEKRGKGERRRQTDIQSVREGRGRQRHRKTVTDRLEHRREPPDLHLGKKPRDRETERDRDRDRRREPYGNGMTIHIPETHSATEQFHFSLVKTSRRISPKQRT